MNAWGSRKFVEASLGIPGMVCFFPPSNLLQQIPLQHAQNRRQAAFLIWLERVKIFDQPPVLAPLKTLSQHLGYGPKRISSFLNVFLLTESTLIFHRDDP